MFQRVSIAFRRVPEAFQGGSRGLQVFQGRPLYPTVMLSKPFQNSPKTVDMLLKYVGNPHGGLLEPLGGPVKPF